MKKILSFMLAVLLVPALLIGCSATQAATIPVHVAGSIFGGNNADSLSVNLSYDQRWLTKEDNTVYNKDLAAFAALISADTYFREKDLAKGTANRVLIDGADSEAYDSTMLLTALGFSDVQYVESYKLYAYETDTNDSVTLAMAYSNDGGKADCFIVAIRGCFSAGEWNSIFDPGAEDAAYDDITGAHPEWTDRQQVKGVSIAAARAMTIIRDFIAAYDDPDRPNSVLVTGHSRGGAIAEIVGAAFEDDPAFRSCTYTFNAPPVTADASAETYKTIFNLFDSGDYFSNCLPFGSETFYRYGRTLSKAVAEDSEIREAIKQIKGSDDYSYMSTKTAAEYTRLFSALFPDRASLYAPLSTTYRFDDKAEAEAKLAELAAIVSAETGLGLEPLCSLTVITETADGGFEFDVCYCKAALLQSIGKTLAYGQAAYEAIKLLFAEETEFCALEDILMANAAEISAGHRLLNSYVLTKFF